MNKFKKLIGTAGIALVIMGAGVTIPQAASAAEITDPVLVGGGTTSGGTGDTTDGLNVCKTTRYYDTNTPGCRSLPIYPICGVWRTKTTCTRY